MKYKETKINNLIVSDNHVVHNYEENEKEIHLYIKSKNRIGKCPNCNQNCHIHSTYNRTLQDTPIHNKTTLLHVKAYEYECINKKCNISKFNEELEFAKKISNYDRYINSINIMCFNIFK